MQLIGWTRIIARLAGRVGVERRPSLGPSGPDSGWALQIAEANPQAKREFKSDRAATMEASPPRKTHVRYGGPTFPGKPPHHFRDLRTGIVYITHIYVYIVLYHHHSWRQMSPQSHLPGLGLPLQIIQRTAKPKVLPCNTSSLKY